MKSIILAVGLLLILSVGYANPAYPGNGMISEVWFTDNGHLMVELCPLRTEDVRLNEVSIWHGSLKETFRDSTIMVDSNGAVVDVTEQMPNMVFNPAGDTLKVVWIIHYEPNLLHYGGDQLIWGYGEDDHIRPPLPGQSMARYSDEGDFWGGPHWAIDEPPTPGTHCYKPIARSVLKVKVTDQNNDPVPSVVIYRNFTDILFSQTDENGEYSDAILSGKLYVSIRHPLTGEYIYWNTYWVEPYETLTIPVPITMPSSYPYNEYRGLCAFPTPLNVKKDRSVQFRYFGEIKDDSYIKVYDIKGRFIGKVTWGSKGFAHWRPQSDDASGFYIAKLISGNKVLDTIKFSIIN